MSGSKKLALEQLAAVARALGSGHRLELLDVLINGERGVEALAEETGLSVANASQHLQQLHRGGLLTRRRQGKQMIYGLADLEVLHLVNMLRRLAERNLAEMDRVVGTYYRDRDQLEPVTRDELSARLRDGSVVVLDVRDAEEYAAGHIPGALNIPARELEQRLGEIPGGRDIVAYCRGLYCVYSYDALDTLRPRGYTAHRLRGGYADWLAAGLPTESRTDPSPSVQRRATA
ncbi:ArsR family transcriptional regulator [Mycobacterium gordonae]|nr:metalloregulator ArsR/SmtB family transcription factor [Mycobacterium gordonae]OBJ87474.1 ArsR family transcriptional regulator [Mycobacterium gordonae]